jgi:hypothetical protein
MSNARLTSSLLCPFSLFRAWVGFLLKSVGLSACLFLLGCIQVHVSCTFWFV